MSPSMIPTRLPHFASAIARFTATVVLPTPPLPAPTAMTFFTPSTGARPAIGRRHGAHAGRHFDVHRGDARQRRHRGVCLIAHLILHRARRRRQLDAERHAAAVNAQVLDEAERDDVLVQIGILDGRQARRARTFR